MTAQENRVVAETILEQLGGRRFVAMTGARGFMSDGPALVFKLPARFARDGINVVKITLDPSDTYTVRFGRMRGMSYVVVSEVSDVYGDNLRDVFTSRTGLDCSL